MRQILSLLAYIERRQAWRHLHFKQLKRQKYSATARRRSAAAETCIPRTRVSCRHRRAAADDADRTKIMMCAPSTCLLCINRLAHFCRRGGAQSCVKREEKERARDINKRRAAVSGAKLLAWRRHGLSACWQAYHLLIIQGISFGENV